MLPEFYFDDSVQEDFEFPGIISSGEVDEKEKMPARLKDRVLNRFPDFHMAPGNLYSRLLDSRHIAKLVMTVLDCELNCDNDVNGCTVTSYDQRQVVR